jgi:hypothetical protein
MTAMRCSLAPFCAISASSSNRNSRAAKTFGWIVVHRPGFFVCSVQGYWTLRSERLIRVAKASPMQMRFGARPTRLRLAASRMSRTPPPARSRYQPPAADRGTDDLLAKSGGGWACEPTAASTRCAASAANAIVCREWPGPSCQTDSKAPGSLRSALASCASDSDASRDSSLTLRRTCAASCAAGRRRRGGGRLVLQCRLDGGAQRREGPFERATGGRRALVRSSGAQEAL